ncbi:MAG: YitT family protein [Dysgonamonadaceae bacterium]|nr:YitT family protein [Dysgonamonadaceae bacterium]MDD3728355.1 YitT family protein [Dysgonamonadaceae bacterium]
MNLPKKYLKKFYWRDYLVIVLGLIIYSIGLTGFLIPFKFVMGGLGGVSLLIKYSTGIPLWLSFIVFNSFLLIFAWYFLGRKYVFSTLFSSVMLTIILNLSERYITEPLISNETMAILIGAICCGIGLGMVLSMNSSTGGTDIIAGIITKYRYISMGRMLLYIDIFIVLSSYLLFQSVEKIIVGFVIISVLYYAVDMVISGSRQSVQFFIFSSKYDEIATHINSELERGCSVVDGIGWYSKQPQKIIIVLARRNESTSIFRLVQRIDKKAFVSQANVVGVYGKGFEEMK